MRGLRKTGFTRTKTFGYGGDCCDFHFSESSGRLTQNKGIYIEKRRFVKYYYTHSISNFAVFLRKSR